MQLELKICAHIGVLLFSVLTEDVIACKRILHSKRLGKRTVFGGYFSN